MGTEAVARAAPDSHTLLYGGLGPIAAAPHLVPDLRFDPARDLAPVHGIGAAPCLIVVGPRRPWTTLAELAAAARGRPEGLVYASPGVGTAPHLAAEVFQQVAGVRLVHAPYVNTAEMLNDVIGGRVDLTWDFPLTAAPHVREGLLRALAATDFDRVRVASDVPTVMECGFPRGRDARLGRALRPRPHPVGHRRAVGGGAAGNATRPDGAGVFRRDRHGALRRYGRGAASARSWPRSCPALPRSSPAPGRGRAGPQPSSSRPSSVGPLQGNSDAQGARAPER